MQDADVFSLLSSMSAMRRFLGDLLSTSVIAFDNAIRLLTFCDVLSLFSAFLDEILSANLSVILTSSSVRDGHDDDAAIRRWQDDVSGLSMERNGKNRLLRWVELSASI